MKRTWWMGLLAGVAVGAVIFTAGTGLYAQSPGRVSAGDVACLHVGKVFAEYDRQKDLTEEMRTVEQDMQAEGERREGQIDGLQATVNAMNPDDPALVKKMRELFQLQLDAKNWFELMQAEIAREVGLWSRRVYAEIIAVTEEIAQREGYDVVLYLSSPELVTYNPDAVKEQIRMRKVVYANPRIDITQAVLERLNANYRAQPKTQMLQIGPQP